MSDPVTCACLNEAMQPLNCIITFILFLCRQRRQDKSQSLQPRERAGQEQGCGERQLSGGPQCQREAGHTAAPHPRLAARRAGRHSTPPRPHPGKFHTLRKVDKGHSSQKTTKICKFKKNILFSIHYRNTISCAMC
jgi:hypothetical protein